VTYAMLGIKPQFILQQYFLLFCLLSKATQSP